MNLRSKTPILGVILIVSGISFHSFAPDLVMKFSAILVFTRGTRRKLEVRVGYRWKEQFLLKRLLKGGGNREFVYLYINIPDEYVKISGRRRRLFFLQKGREVPRFGMLAIRRKAIF